MGKKNISKPLGQLVYQRWSCQAVGKFNFTKILYLKKAITMRGYNFVAVVITAVVLSQLNGALALRKFRPQFHFHNNNFFFH